MDHTFNFNTTNSTGTGTVVALLETGPLIATLVILCPVVLVVVFGNLLVILAIILDRSLRKPQNLYFISLAIVDLSVGLFILPLNILNILQQGWILGRVMCKIYVTFDLTLCNMSILHLCAIAVDRYRAINDGINYIQQRTFRTILISIGGIFTVSLWVSSPPVLGWDENWLKDADETKACHLLESRGYVIYSSFGSFILPMVIMLYLYMKIYYALRDRIREKSRVKTVNGGGAMELEQSEPDSSANILDEASSSTTVKSLCRVINETTKNIKNNTLPRSTGKGGSKNNMKKGSNVSLMSQQLQDFIAKKQKFSLSKERNAARTLGMIMGAFALCWLPFCFMYITVPFLPEELKPSMAVFEIFTWLGYVNSGLNPIIYTVFNLEFRRAFKRILHI